MLTATRSGQLTGERAGFDGCLEVALFEVRLYFGGGGGSTGALAETGAAVA